MLHFEIGDDFALCAARYSPHTIYRRCATQGRRSPPLSLFGEWRCGTQRRRRFSGHGEHWRTGRRRGVSVSAMHNPHRSSHEAGKIVGIKLESIFERSGQVAKDRHFRRKGPSCGPTETAWRLRSQKLSGGDQPRRGDTAPGAAFTARAPLRGGNISKSARDNSLSSRASTEVDLFHRDLVEDGADAFVIERLVAGQDRLDHDVSRSPPLDHEDKGIEHRGCRANVDHRSQWRQIDNDVIERLAGLSQKGTHAVRGQELGSSAGRAS